MIVLAIPFALAGYLVWSMRRAGRDAEAAAMELDRRRIARGEALPDYRVEARFQAIAKATRKERRS
jgi:hypothetical protein